MKNIIPDLHCYECEGWGWVEIFHPSTDALIGTRKCDNPIHKIGRTYKYGKEYSWKYTEAEMADWPPF